MSSPAVRTRSKTSRTAFGNTIQNVDKNFTALNDTPNNINNGGYYLKPVGGSLQFVELKASESSFDDSATTISGKDVQTIIDNIENQVQLNKTATNTNSGQVTGSAIDGAGGLLDSDFTAQGIMRNKGSGNYDTFDNGVDDLSSGLVDQLKNIGGNSIATNQWGYLAASDQAISTTDDVQFNKVNKLNLTEQTNGFTIQGGSNTNRTLTVDDDITLSNFMQNLSDDSDPKLGGNLKTQGNNEIFDGNGNTILAFNQNSSAVNYVEVQNSATSNDVSVNPRGSDADISLDFVPKGTGTIKKNGTELVTASDLKAVDTSYNNGNSNLSSTDVKSALDELDSDRHEKNKDTELDKGGANNITASTLNTHVNNNDLHRQINDSGTGSDELWSADKVNTELQGKAGTTHTHSGSDIDSGTIPDARIAPSSVTQHEASIDHNSLSNYDADEHRKINDSGTGSDELWSANEIDSRLTNKVDTTGGLSSNLTVSSGLNISGGDGYIELQEPTSTPSAPSNSNDVRFYASRGSIGARNNSTNLRIAQKEETSISDGDILAYNSGNTDFDAKQPQEFEAEQLDISSSGTTTVSNGRNLTILVDTSSADSSIEIPEGDGNYYYTIKDIGGNANNNNIEIKNSSGTTVRTISTANRSETVYTNSSTNEIFVVGCCTP